MNSWDDRDANVTCKKLGYAGGVAYLHIMKNRKPIMMNQVHCNGNENNLIDCVHSLKPDLKNCAFHSNDAGILCYQSKGKLTEIFVFNCIKNILSDYKCREKFYFDKRNGKTREKHKL